MNVDEFILMIILITNLTTINPPEPESLTRHEEPFHLKHSWTRVQPNPSGCLSAAILEDTDPPAPHQDQKLKVH